MKVALLHDWLTGFRGGERVFEVFCELFPEAPIYTLIHVPGSTSNLIDSHPITTSFLNSLPGVEKHYRKFLPLFPKAVEAMKIKEDVDLVLSSSHCVIKGLEKPTKETVHISYIHSPMRYFYDQYDNYFGPQAPVYQRLGAKVFKNYIVDWDKRSNDNVDYMIANAAFVKQRIQTYYERDSAIIHPFVDLDDFNETQEHPADKEDYFLVLSAFAPNKRVDLAVEAFNRLKLPLKIIGSGQLERELREQAGENVEFLGNLSREEVVEHLKRAQALVFPGVEDFGITPLEALASGTPVIAYKTGGVLETLNDEVAVFFDEPTVDSLVAGIEKFKGKTFEHTRLRARAQDFSKERFKKEIMDFITDKMKGKL